jgi:defect-in-organelle-trafficking protein DotB
MGAVAQAAITGHSVKSTAHADNASLMMQRVVSLLPPDERDNLISAVAQALRLVINQRLISSIDGCRVAIREFLVIDPPLRNQFLRTDAKDWPALTRQAIDEKGQSYRKAIELALNANLITEQTAAYQLRQVA